MKNSFSLFILFFLLFTGAHAAIRRVNYNTNFPLTNVDYTSLSAAVTAAVVGDTIQIYGVLSSTAVTISKRLTIQGFGYNFDVHPNLQVNSTNGPSEINSSSSYVLTFSTGSENSVVEGIYFSGNTTISIRTSNVTLRRCFFSSATPLNFQNTISNVFITQSVISSVNTNSAAISNLNFYNCILGGMNFVNATNSSIQIINCVTGAGSNSWTFGTNSLVVQNSIITTYNSANVNAVYANNFFGTAQPSPLPAGSNNRWGQNWADLFNRLGGTSNNPGDLANAAFDELYFVLKAGSTAINGGFNSGNIPTDCGIFGGEPAYRYKVSGLPAIPSTYLLTAPSPSASSNPYNVTISIKSQD